MRSPKTLPPFWKYFTRGFKSELPETSPLQTLPLDSAVTFLESTQQDLSKDDFTTLLRRSTDARSLDHGQRIHRQMHDRGFIHNRFLCNLLIDLYTKCARFHEALSVFEHIRERNLYSWTMMLAAFAHNRHFEKTSSFFRQMLFEGFIPTEFGVSIFISACTEAGCLTSGRAVHEWIHGTEIESEFIVQTALVSMYGKLGSTPEAESIFQTMTRVDVVAWSAMIAAYSRNGQPSKALYLFQRMDNEGVPPNNVTFVSGLHACANLGAYQPGLQMHERVISQRLHCGVVLGTAILNFYGKCGRVERASEIFDQLTERNVVTWSALVAAHAQNGHNRSAIQLFHKMDLEGIPPNAMTFVSILDACAGSAALRLGKRIHSRIEALSQGLETDVYVLTALVNMYSKCGSLSLAGDLFNRTSSTRMDQVLWNTLVSTNAQHGESQKALELFRTMVLYGIVPTVMTFTSVLFACSHAGMLHQGRDHFLTFVGDHGVAPEGEHYGCLVDLLGRAGWLQDGEDLLTNMPFEPHLVSWMSFLGSCRTYKDLRRATWAAEHVFHLDPRKRAPFILLSNMHAKAGRWSEVAKLRKAMQACMVVKEAGKSWVEIKDRVHEFISGDIDHPRIVDIQAEMERLTKLMKEAGYVPDTETVLHDVGADVKETMVRHHSEKLAIAFALLMTPEGRTIHVVKNLRVCSDCHSATKVLSRVVKREIIVRDSNRFHRFVNGSCSCDDYW